MENMNQRDKLLLLEIHDDCFTLKTAVVHSQESVSLG